MIKEDQRFCASGATLKSAFDETHVCVSSQEDSWKQTEEVAVYLIPVALGWLKSLTMREEKLDGKGGAVLRKQNTPGASDRSLCLILQKALQNRCFHWLVFFLFLFIYLFLRTHRSTDAFFITLPQVAEKKKLPRMHYNNQSKMFCKPPALTGKTAVLHQQCRAASRASLTH